MKRIISITLMLLFLTPAIGVNGTVHYCGGEIASITVNGLGSSEKCSCGSKRMKSDCCNDEDFSFQLEDELYKSSPICFNIKKSIDFSHVFITQIYFDFSTPYIQEEVCLSHHPPDYVKTPLYISHQVFRI